MSLLRRAVIATRRLPGLRGAYRAAYRAAARASAGGLGALEGARQVYLHRGLTGNAWEPGLSDIDLILVREEAAGEEAERRSLARLARRAGGFRRVFPMLSEPWVGTGREVRNYLRWGGLRAEEDPPRWRPLLAGEDVRGVGRGGSLEKRRWLDPWTEAFDAYRELSSRYFRPFSGLPQKRRREARNLFLDVMRCAGYILGESADESGWPLSRADMARTLGPLARMTLEDFWLHAFRALARASRAALERLSGPSAEEARPPEGARGRTHKALERFIGRTPEARWVFSNPPYHTYVVTSAEPEEGALVRAKENTLRLQREGSLPNPLVLTPEAFILLAQSSYEPGPWQCWDARGWKSSAGLFAPWRSPAVFGEFPAPFRLLPAALRREAAATAASWLALTWRPLWNSAEGNRYALFHLYTRVLGLRLRLEGRPCGPLWDWEGLLDRACVFREDGPFLESLREWQRAEPEECVEGLPRAGLAAEHFAFLRRSLESLQDRLETGAPLPCS